MNLFSNTQSIKMPLKNRTLEFICTGLAFCLTIFLFFCWNCCWFILTTWSVRLGFSYLQSPHWIIKLNHINNWKSGISLFPNIHWCKNKHHCHHNTIIFLWLLCFLYVKMSFVESNEILINHLLNLWYVFSLRKLSCLYQIKSAYIGTINYNRIIGIQVLTWLPLQIQIRFCQLILSPYYSMIWFLLAFM